MRIRSGYHSSAAPFSRWTVALFHFPVSSQELAQTGLFICVRGLNKPPIQRRESF